MKKTSQLPKDDSLMENRDTLAYGEQTTDKIPDRSEDMAEGPDEDDPALESDVEDDGTPVLTEEDLEENDLSEEDADEIEWEEKKEG